MNGGKGRVQNRRLDFRYYHGDLLIITRGKTEQIFTDVSELVEFVNGSNPTGFKSKIHQPIAE